MLPLGWKGACTLEAIIPNVTIIEDPQSQSPLETTHRIKWTPDNPLVKLSSILQFCKVFFALVKGESITKSYCKHLKTQKYCKNIEDLENKFAKIVL